MTTSKGSVSGFCEKIRIEFTKNKPSKGTKVKYLESRKKVLRKYLTKCSNGRRKFPKKLIDFQLELKIKIGN